MGDGGRAIVERAPVSLGYEAQATQAGDYRLFVGWGSDPFLFDKKGAVNDLQFTGDDYFANQNVCSIGFSETMAPLAWNRMVFIGSAGGEYGIRVSVTAYSQADGKQVWRWWATNPGEAVLREP